MLQSTTGSRYSEFKKLQNRCKDFQQKQLKYFYVLVDYYGCHRLVGITSDHIWTNWEELLIGSD